MSKHYGLTLFMIALLVVLTVPASSAMLSFNGTQPAVDADDISCLVGAGPDQDNVGTATTDGSANDATTYIAPDRPAQGQTFVTPGGLPGLSDRRCYGAACRLYVQYGRDVV